MTTATTIELNPFARRPKMNLPELIAQLDHQEALKDDFIVPAHQMRVTPEGYLEVDRHLIDESGVSTVSYYRTTGTFDSGVASKLNIPANYLTRMREHGELRLMADNINTWLAREPNKPFMVRTFRPTRGDNHLGTARGLLSDSYAIRDNKNLLLAALQGIKDLGAEVQVRGELTERRMYVEFVAPQVTADGTELLQFYRSPFNGRDGRGFPVVAAGALLTNSEIGFGAAALTPRFEFELCTNGMTITEDVMRSIHIGSKHETGVVRYSADTLRKELEAVTAKVRDAVRTFLDADYMVGKLNEITRQAQVQVIDPSATIKHVGKVVGYTQDEQARILAHFVRGADISAGGVMHAVTSAAQTLTNPDAAHELERSSLKALSAAAGFQR